MATRISRALSLRHLAANMLLCFLLEAKGVMQLVNSCLYHHRDEKHVLGRLGRPN